MFQWDKTIDAVNVPACKVVHLFRSMREVQLALPGVSAQQASAFLCQYQVEDGIATVAAFHLHKSQVLAFYSSDPRVVPVKGIDTMLDQGLNFVESMGFLMTDQDLQLLDEADQEMLWSSLPIKTGLTGEEAEAPLVVVTAKATSERPAAKLETTKVEAAQQQKTQPEPAVAHSQAVNGGGLVAAPVKSAPKVEPNPAASDNVDDLLAAVEAMRAKRPGLRARKSPPTAEEIGRRRLQLREIIGRILASL
ncbi:MAG: hypothetical protein OEL80_02325 [Desulfuromonadales bacterium]|jgi:hypothetical protein|nr:hypothetical protein [Desulfuromonadales bacterium]